MKPFMDLDLRLRGDDSAYGELVSLLLVEVQSLFEKLFHPRQGRQNTSLRGHSALTIRL
jgi:hypothetical protein